MTDEFNHPLPTPGNEAEAREQALNEREKALDEREQALNEREQALAYVPADERERWLGDPLRERGHWDQEPVVIVPGNVKA
jgi:hypothetical protein